MAVTKPVPGKSYSVKVQIGNGPGALYPGEVVSVVSKADENNHILLAFDTFGDVLEPNGMIMVGPITRHLTVAADSFADHFSLIKR